MKRMSLLITLVCGMLLGMTSYAAEYSLYLDDSNMQVDPQADLSQFDTWLLGAKFKGSGVLASVGIELKEVPLDEGRENFHMMGITNANMRIGVFNGEGKGNTVYPKAEEASCQINKHKIVDNMRVDAKLYGTITVRDNHPTIDNLSCIFTYTPR